MPATAGTAAEESGARTDGLGTTGKDGEGANNPDKWGAAAGETTVEHSARGGAAAVNLIVACADPSTWAPVAAGETKVGTMPNLGGDETRAGVPAGGKIPACAAGNLGRAATTFVLLGNKVVLRPDVPAGRTGVALGVVASKGGPTAGVHATKGQLTAGTPGSLAGDWGKTGTRGATLTWLAPWGGTDALVLGALAVGT